MKWIVITGGAFVIVFILFLLSLNDGSWQMIACNVGQGDAFVLQKGRFQILIDGGPSLERLVVCLERNLPMFDKHIEVVLVTHADHDHYGGLVGLIDYYSVGIIYHNVYSDKEDDKYNYFVNYINDIANKYTKYSKVRNRQKIVYKDGEFEMYLNNITNLQNSTNTSSNLQSIVSIFNTNLTSIIFTADSDAMMLNDIIVQNYLFDKLNQNRIMIIPHHGSKSGLDHKLLNIVKPSFCILSVGKNSYGHPSQEVIKLVSSINCKLLSTHGNKYIKVAL